jgi:hypothetical protein
LRADFGFTSPAAWSLSLETEHAEPIPLAWYEQETLRGDFLRAIEQLRMNPAAPLEIDAYLSDSHQAGILAAAATIHDKSVRRQVLEEAALLGVELLGGEA